MKKTDDTREPSLLSTCRADGPSSGVGGGIRGAPPRFLVPPCLPYSPPFPPTCMAGRTVLAVVWVAPETIPSASPTCTIITPNL